MPASSDFSSAALSRSSRFGAIQQVLHVSTRFVLTPFVVMGVGLDAYALWSLMFALLGWVGLHRTGFASAAIPLATSALARGRSSEANENLRAAANLTVIPAVLCLLLAWWWGEAILRSIGVSDDIVGDATSALVLAVLATSLSLLASGFQGALEARNEFHKTKSIEMGAATLESILIVVSLSLEGGLLGLALAYAARLASQVLGFFLAARRHHQSRRVLPGMVSSQALRRVWAFGISMQGVGFVHLTIGSLDRLLVIHLLGLEVAGLLELARKLAGFGAGVVAQAIAPLGPAVAHQAERTPKGVPALMARGSRLTAFFGLLPLALLAAVPEAVMVAWIGEVPPRAAFVLRLVALGAFVHLLTGPWTAALRGLAEPRMEVLYSLAWLTLLVIGVPLGGAVAGLEGAVTASVFAQAASSLLLIFLASRRFRVSVSETTRATALPTSLGVVVAVLVAASLPSISASSARLEAASVVALAALGVLSLVVLLAGRFILTGSDWGVLISGLRTRSSLAPTTSLSESSS